MHDLEEELRNRGRGHSTRVEVVERGDEDLIAWIGESLDMLPEDITRVSGPLDLTLLFGVGGVLKRPDLEYPSFSPRRSKALAGCPFTRYSQKMSTCCITPMTVLTQWLNWCKRQLTLRFWRLNKPFIG